MANSSSEYWDIDGTSLHQFGWSVATLGGSRFDLPPRRGENIQLAYRPGQIHRAKLADARTINLVMWMTGSTPGTGTAPSDPRLAFNDNWDTLRRLVWKPNGAQVTLTRRWYLTVGGVKTLVSASALAEVADSMTPTMTGRTRAEFTMTLLLADPFFYGTQVNTTLDVSDPEVINNPGHDVAGWTNFTIELAGPLTNPKVTNASPNPDVWVKYNGVIGNGSTVTLDVAAFTAYLGSTNVIGNVTHSGARNWMALQPGNNTLTLTADSGSGTATVRFKPPYI